MVPRPDRRKSGDGIIRAQAEYFRCTCTSSGNAMTPEQQEKSDAVTAKLRELSMSKVPETSYDEIPYSNNAFYHTHPDCLATVATLFGMKPAPVQACRVLELGCGRGGNLIPMATSLPTSRFVGIDLSARQIAGGQEAVESLGLTNVELKQLSILDVDSDFGRFDYIICHGVYSWVPAAVQEKILEICAQNLAPSGIAYISYNCYPGWHLRG